MEHTAERWLQKSAEMFLRNQDMREGQKVVDFGCNNGNYTIPAARIVGETGTVYAIDKDKTGLQELKHAVRDEALENVHFIQIKDGKKIPLPVGHVDMVLLYDVLHRGYMPEAAQRERLLRQVYQVLKPNGLLSFYPTHIRKYGITLNQVLKEVKSVGFQFRQKSRRTLVHDGKLVRGYVFKFSKC